MDGASSTHFVEERSSRWDELDAIVEKATKKGLKRVAPAELETFLRLYRSTSADLARVRTLGVDGTVVDRVNRLVGRSHALLYRTPSEPLAIGAFYRTDFPRLFRQTWRFSAASVLISIAFFLMARSVVGAHPEIVADLVGGGGAEFSTSHHAGDFSERFQAAPGPLITSFVTTNNIGVAFRAFAFGITFGLGTLYVLIVNGAMLGGFAGAYEQSGLGREFWFTVLPHGALELSAIMIAGGAGLAVGWALWSPGRRPRIVRLREESLRAVRIAAGLIPAFVVAGSFEGFLTPSRAIAAPVKVAVGAAAAVVFWLYLIFAGRENAET